MNAKPGASTSQQGCWLIFFDPSDPTLRAAGAYASAPKKGDTLKVLQEQLASLSRHGPVLLIWEDIHWIDPTSLELLDHVVEQIQRLPILAIVTFRPEFKATWTGLPHTTALTLNRLERQQAGKRKQQRLIRLLRACRGRRRPGALLSQRDRRPGGALSWPCRASAAPRQYESNLTFALAMVGGTHRAARDSVAPYAKSP